MILYILVHYDLLSWSKILKIMRSQGGDSPHFLTGVLGAGVWPVPPKYLRGKLSRPQNIWDLNRYTPKYHLFFTRQLTGSIHFRVTKFQTPNYQFRLEQKHNPKLSEMSKIPNPKISAEHPRQKMWRVTPLGSWPSQNCLFWSGTWIFTY